MKIKSKGEGNLSAAHNILQNMVFGKHLILFALCLLLFNIVILLYPRTNIKYCERLFFFCLRVVTKQKGLYVLKIFITYHQQYLKCICINIKSIYLKLSSLYENIFNFE